MNCPICFDPIADKRPCSLPCGHSFCTPCIDNLRIQSCPECRRNFNRNDIRPNYALNNYDVTSVVHDLDKDLFNIDGIEKFVIIDNSNSMLTEDSTIIDILENGVIIETDNCVRYKEAHQRTKFILDQCIENKVKSTFYLMNKKTNSSNYIENIDYVIYDPNNYNEGTFLIIFNKLFDYKNIFGMTPLSKITNHIRQTLEKNCTKGMIYTIIFVTDGEPNVGRL